MLTSSMCQVVFNIDFPKLKCEYCSIQVNEQYARNTQTGTPTHPRTRTHDTGEQYTLAASGEP